jgi:hypothetical protein
MIIWLASYPRSGNSLLQIILKETFGLQTYDIYPPFTTASGNDKSREIVGNVDEYLDEQRLSEAAVSDHTYFVKTHDPPKDHAKAIYIVRDGRSTVVSYFHFLKEFEPEWKSSIEDIVVGDCDFGSWTDHFKAWAPKRRSNTLLLRYEDMVCNPSSVIKTIAEYLELPVLSSEIPSFTELQAVEPRFFRAGSNTTSAYCPSDSGLSYQVAGGACSFRSGSRGTA